MHRHLKRPQKKNRSLHDFAACMLFENVWYQPMKLRAKGFVVAKLYFDDQNLAKTFCPFD